MRTARALAIGAGMLFASVAIADSTTQEFEELRPNMAFFMTPSGSYLALAQTSERNYVFFGKGRDLFRQRVLISATDDDDNLSLLLWAPDQIRDATMEERDEKWWLRCGETEVELSVVDPEEREVLVGSVRFHPPRFKRTPYALGRNERGEYFYVDRADGSRGNDGFDVYVGRAGKAAKQKLRWVVSDSEGDVFATRGGELRISRDDASTSLQWKPKKRKKAPVALLSVPIAQNSYLIYKQLGVYENQAFGTPCVSNDS